MKLLKKITVAIAALCVLAVPCAKLGGAKKATAAETRSVITTTPTGYTKASDVQYKTVGSYIANWGARGEDGTFLSSKATSFYTGSYVYDTLSEKSGGSSQSNAPQSALYSSLKTLMTNKHSHKTSYDETKGQYRYTDCLRNDYSTISSFYSGKSLTGTWDGAATWNREHTWPKSKETNGNAKTDIMMLRPTWVQENSSRGNTAYGESGSYYDPGESTRGDCARIVLYVYVRWGNTSKMWGTSGVMENMNVLLRWMEEDPVDTWEMGRNDAVQAITGTRNVFVDYPEYAWLLFGKSIPTDMPTPSGENSDETTTPPVDSTEPPVDSTEPPVDSTEPPVDSTEPPVDSTEPPVDSTEPPVDSTESTCQHVFSEWMIVIKPTETTEGLRARYCEKCLMDQSESLPKITQSGDSSGDQSEDSSGCQHVFSEWFVIKEATETEDGLRARYCEKCMMDQSEVIPKNSATDGETGCAGVVGAPLVGALLLATGAYALRRKKEN